MADIYRVIALAKERGLSQAFIVRKCGRYRSFLTCVKNGKDRINDEHLLIIADLLQTTPEYLRGETDIKEKAPAGLGEGKAMREEQMELNSIAEQLPTEDVLVLLRIAQALHAQNQANARAQKRKDNKP